MIAEVREALPATPAGERAAWVLERILDVANGGDAPDRGEITEQFAPAWLAEVPVEPGFFVELAPVLAATVTLHPEEPAADEARVVLGLADGTFRRLRVTVEAAAPHRLTFLLFSPASDPARTLDRVIERGGRSVPLRDHGGDGPVVVLWHGSGCDATVWDGVAAHLPSCRVVAPDLPGHGGSPLPRLSVADTIADTEAVLDELGLDDAFVVGHSLGGWIALHFAATSRRCRGLVCLDGPVALDYAEMGLPPEHPGFVADPPDVVADLAALRVPALLVLGAGTSTAETAWMVPFRQGLHDHVEHGGAPVRVEWIPSGHMMIVFDAASTAERVVRFVREHAG